MRFGPGCMTGGGEVVGKKRKKIPFVGNWVGDTQESPNDGKEQRGENLGGGGGGGGITFLAGKGAKKDLP